MPSGVRLDFHARASVYFTRSLAFRSPQIMILAGATFAGSDGGRWPYMPGVPAGVWRADQDRRARRNRPNPTMPDAIAHSAFDANMLTATSPVKNKSGKGSTVYFNLNGAGNEKLQIRLTSGTDAPTTAPFGVNAAPEERPDAIRRGLMLGNLNEGLLQTIERIDAYCRDTAQRMRLPPYTSLIKEDRTDTYPPTLRTKINVAGPYVPKIFEVNEETMQMLHMPGFNVLDIERGQRMHVIVALQGLWVAGTACGAILNVTNVALYPQAAKNTATFDIAGFSQVAATPTATPSAPAASAAAGAGGAPPPPSYGGSYGGGGGGGSYGAGAPSYAGSYGGGAGAAAAGAGSGVGQKRPIEEAVPGAGGYGASGGPAPKRPADDPWATETTMSEKPVATA
jgi:hypothetical protein